MTANGRHLQLSGRRGTHPDWVRMARVALGGRIELDPMSEPAFNKIVRAKRIFTAEDDGLTQPWAAETVLINPHGGLVVEAWRKLVAEWQLGNVRRAIWIGFSVEQLNVLADEPIHPDDFSKLTVRRRMDFLTTEPLRVVVGVMPDDSWMLECGHSVITAKKHKAAKRLRCPCCEGATPEPLGAPTHSNYVVGIGIPADYFEAAFAGRGRFAHGRNAIVDRASEEAFGGVA